MPPLVRVGSPHVSCIALAPYFSDDERSMDVFSAYRSDLFGRDLAYCTQTRYWQVIANYQKWLGERSPDILTVPQYLAWLRAKGYQQRSILLYYHALQTFFSFLGQKPLRLKLRKPKVIPPYYDRKDIERLIVQAESGLRCQKEWQKQRNKTLILTLDC
jgi:integrase